MATENAQKNANLSYDSNDNLSSFKDERNAQYTYTYSNSGNKHRLTKATNKATDVTYAYTYYGSDKGNNLRAQEVQNSSGSMIIRTGIVYTPEEDGIAEGAYVYRESDQHAYSTYYTYDKKSGLLKRVKNANGDATDYTYDENNDNLTKVVSDGNTVNYSYDASGTRLTAITHNGFDYSFTYDNFGNVLTTKAAGTTLMTNTYGTGNGLLNKSTYGNDDYVNYVYDDLGRTTRINKNGSNTYYWRYNANGDTAMHTDYVSDRVYYYTYDSLGRIVAETEKTRGEDEYRFSNNYVYDLSNNLTKLVSVSDGTTSSTSHTYDAANRPEKTTLNGTVSYEYDYDALGRMSKITLNNSSTDVLLSYTYLDSARNEDNSTTYKTTQIGTETIGDRAYTYTYDKVGNITAITEKKTGATGYTEKVTYTYDELGQLESENNVDLGQKIEYTYDDGGNISQKKMYSYTNGAVGSLQKTVDYTYDSTWTDKLTEYDGQDISYDEIGNPTTYRDGMSFTWQGRQMKTATLGNTSVSYKYNADGLRTYKKVGSTVYEYEYSGDKLIYEKRGDLQFHYRYDAYGNLATIRRIKPDGSEFSLYAFTNMRGDVEELRMSNGALYARYVYDSWGNVLAVLNSSGNPLNDVNNVAVQNPIRYRGYYYDAESGLYYLQSRYYDPVTGRFVNPDSLIDTSNVLGFNMYAYCGNNPVNREDNGGNLWDVVFDIASIAYSAYQVCKEPTNLWNWVGLAADAVSLVIPGVTGGGAAVRALTKADDVIDATRAVSKVDDAADVARAADSLGNVSQVVVKSGGEVKLPTQISASNAVDKWDEFLGPNQTNINKFTGEVDSNRIFSADGSKRIRFGNHEMNSLGTPKAHFHYETWDFNPINNTVTVFNELQRLK